MPGAGGTRQSSSLASLAGQLELLTYEQLVVTFVTQTSPASSLTSTRSSPAQTLSAVVRLSTGSQCSDSSRYGIVEPRFPRLKQTGFEPSQTSGSSSPDQRVSYVWGSSTQSSCASN